MEIKDVERNIRTLCENKNVRSLLVAQQMFIDSVDRYSESVGDMYGPEAAERSYKKIVDGVQQVTSVMSASISDAIYEHLSHV